MKRIMIVLCAFFALQFSFSQVFVYDPPFQTEYKIIAPSGLKLREEPNTNSRVLGLIPYGEKILVNLHNSLISPEIIEGKKGDWKEAIWEGKQGYVFDAFIQYQENTPPFTLHSSSMDLINEWHKTYFNADEIFFGLFRTQDLHYFELKNIDLKSSDDPRFSLPEDTHDIPIWYGKGLHFEKPRKIEGKEINRIIYSGESINISHGEIYGAGEVIQNDSIQRSEYENRPYELRYKQTYQEKVIDQLLLKMNFYQGLGGRNGYEGRAIVNFIGDLDGDEKEDLILTYQTTYKGWNYVFYSTKYAEAGRAFKAFHVGSGTE